MPSAVGVACFMLTVSLVRGTESRADRGRGRYRGQMAVYVRPRGRFGRQKSGVPRPRVLVTIP
jgi:hypothetical protein